jgi:hypothetical protein
MLTFLQLQKKPSYTASIQLPGRHNKHQEGNGQLPESI